MYGVWEEGKLTIYTYNDIGNFREIGSVNESMGASAVGIRNAMSAEDMRDGAFGKEGSNSLFSEDEKKGKTPYLDIRLDGYTRIQQSDDYNCKNAVLASIEKLNGGTRDQAKFKSEGSKLNPNTRLKSYFEHFGFETKYNMNLEQIINEMKKGNPTVIDFDVDGNASEYTHVFTITRILQKKKDDVYQFWVADPLTGTQYYQMELFNYNQFKGSYTFLLVK